LRLAILSPQADVAFPLSKQGRRAVRQLSGLNRPAHRCLCLCFAVRLATHHARLEVGIESLLLFRRALPSPTNMPVYPGALASLRCPILLSSFSSVRQLLKSEKQKPSILENNS